MDSEQPVEIKAQESTPALKKVQALSVMNLGAPMSINRIHSLIQFGASGKMPVLQSGMPSHPQMFIHMQPQMGMMTPGQMMRAPGMMSDAMPVPETQTIKHVIQKCSYPDCNKTFVKTRDLYNHLRNAHHTNFCCPYCEKKASCMSNFVIHCRLHTNEKPWHCPLQLCSYSGKTKAHCKSHMIQHHGVQYYKMFNKHFNQDRRFRLDKGYQPLSVPRSLQKRQDSKKRHTYIPVPIL